MITQDFFVPLFLHVALNVLFLQVEDCLVLARLASELPELRYKAYLLPGTDTATGQNVGLLTRVDPVIDLERTSNRNSALPSSRCYVARDLSAGHYDYQPTGLSKHYHTAIRLGGHLLHLYGVHLKADPNAPLACIQREGQALVLREYILSHLRPSSPASTTSGSGIESHAAAFSGVTHQHVVVLGDLNDFDPSFAHDPTLSTPRSVVIPTLLALSPQTESDNLFNAAAKLRAVDRYSWEGALHGAPRHRSLLDHMLLSKDLYDRIVRVEIPHHDLPSARDASDHFPLLVKLDVSGF